MLDEVNTKKNVQMVWSSCIWPPLEKCLVLIHLLAIRKYNELDFLSPPLIWFMSMYNSHLFDQIKPTHVVLTKNL